MSFFDAWLKGYDAATEDRKAPYGDAWAQRIAKGGREGLEQIAADPSVTVHAMAEALVVKSPKTRYLTGNMAKFFFKPMSWLPHSLQDKVLMGMTFQGPPPIGLARM